jgi:hypothetical protein
MTLAWRVKGAQKNAHPDWSAVAFAVPCYGKCDANITTKCGLRRPHFFALRRNRGRVDAGSKYRRPGKRLHCGFSRHSRRRRRHLNNPRATGVRSGGGLTGRAI